MHLRFISLLIILSLFSGCSLLTRREATPTLAPATDWRIAPESILSSGIEQDRLQAIYSGQSGTFSVAPGDDHWVAVELDENRDSPVMLTYSQPDRQVRITTIWEQSADSTTGTDGTWELVEKRNVRWFLDKVEVPPDAPRWVRLRFEPRETWPEDRPVEYTDIALYEPNPAERNDYWLIIGASIQQQSIQNNVFHGMVTERWSGYDPVMFNLAVGGWRTDHLRDALPEFLARHPNASYVGIHIGGNNVSANRPYPGGAQEIREDIVQILEMIQEAGKVPVLSRLSYRAYHPNGDRGPVPPEENGSGPYVSNIYDPLILEYCPEFVDPTTGLCVVNAYDYFRAHPEELSTDGVHVNPVGQTSWNRLWVEGAGSVIYGN